MGHDPFNRQSPSPNHQEPYPTSSYPLHAIPPPQQFQLQPQQQQPTASFTPDQSFNLSTTDLSVPPLHSLSNQTSTTLFQPYGDQDHDLDDMNDLPLLRAPSARSQETLLSVNMPGQYANLDEESINNIRYGRIPQRVPRRYKTLKRIECVFYLSRPHIMPAHSHPSRFVTQALPWQFRA